jgi:hypothetical protein
MELFPPMPLASWQDTKQTLHRFCQVVGKIRLAASVRRNHWWNVPFHLTGRGITTRPMDQAGTQPGFTIDFDFLDHQLRISTLDGQAAAVPLQGQSVASFHDQTLQALAKRGGLYRLSGGWRRGLETRHASNPNISGYDGVDRITRWR